jgi:isopentenyl diphosphate isomerase/L-lactate dehydrogenase-like FMN-dependent dehydrogenase
VSDPTLTNDFRTLHDIVAAARKRTERGPWEYLMGAAETETTFRRNRLAIDSLAFRPRVLRDVRAIDCTTALFGQPSRLPVFLAPIGSCQSLDPSGALGVAKAAESFGVMNMLSSVTQPGLEEIAAETRHPKMYQLYVRGDRAWVREQVERVVRSGYVAFCLTVDTAVYSRRERDLISGWAPPARHSVTGENAHYQAALEWDTVKWYKDHYALPLILKGVATAEDAALAVEHGVDVVYVSNHGGRQLDHGLGSIEVLPEVVQAVGGRARVFVDGGFYRGTDVLKAIALGAHAVGLGRLGGLGLAAAGEAGVLRVLELLEIEMRTSMGLLGTTRLAQLDASCLRTTTPADAPSAFASPFLFLDWRESAS